MLEDYGFDSRDRYPTENISAMIQSPSRKLKSRGMRNIQAEGSRIVPRLTWKTLASHSTDDVIVPANTPLHSSHGFGDYHEYHSPLGHSKFGTNKAAFSESSASEREIPLRPHYHRVDMELNDGDAVVKPKKILLWCPNSTSNRRKPSAGSIRSTKDHPFLKAVSLPLSTVPEFKKDASLSHKAIRGNRSRKPQGYLVRSRQRSRASTAKLDKSTSTSAFAQPEPTTARATPQEIAQLRRVPVDILIRVLNQAEEKGVITPKQSAFLLDQVLGQKNKLPAIKKTKQQQTDQSAFSQDQAPSTPLETKNLKILNADERIYSPRTMSVDPVYKVDTTSEANNPQDARGKIPVATKVSDFNPPTTLNPINFPKMEETTNPNLDAGHDLKMEDDLDSKYNENLREVAAKNLRLRNLSREAPTTPKKTPVKYVATVFDSIPQTPPVKPFHYPKSPREMFLGPIPSPPPPTPPTERDSAYDEQAGGSTVLVNPSSTGPPTVTSYGEKFPSSPSGSKTPTTGREIEARLPKHQMKISSQKRRSFIASPFGSSTVEGWPQINEEDFMIVGESPELVGSPMPSFTEEEIRAISRIGSSSSTKAETPISEKFQAFQQSDIHSPAPPPPSPEPLGIHNRLGEARKIPTSPRGSSTAMGLMALGKSSLASPTTPTPVVSTATTSDVETPLGRITRAQRLSSTPAIAETPNENESDVGESPMENSLNNELENICHAVRVDPHVDKDTGLPKTDNDFEKNVSPEIAKEELELEMKKLDISEQE